MGRFSRLERETQDALVKQKTQEKKVKERPQGQEESYDASYYAREADEAFFHGEFKDALQLYSRAIQTDNMQHYPWLGQIYCQIELAQLKEADIWCARALELFPEDSAILSLRAVMYANRGMYKRALATSDYAISQKGAEAHSFVARGNVLLLAENKNASLCFIKAMELAGENEWQIPMRIGFIYFKRKEYTLALDYFQKACALNVANDYLWYHLGQCYHRLGFFTKAMESYQQAAAQNPENKQVSAALARLSHSSLFFTIFRRILGIFR
jgi:tetratricopeptide (TPR) repeat protein